MGDIIQWCNDNNGFLTGVLSLLTLIVSIVAIVVSIRTAKLPYVRKLRLSSSFDIAFFQNPVTGESGSQIMGISVNIANIGSRNVNISYLGISVNGRQEKLTKIRDEVTGTGILAPTEVKTEFFKKADLVYVLSRLDKKAKISLYARDTEGNEYFQKAGYAYKMVEQLSK
jgi:hypothetical protein